MMARTLSPIARSNAFVTAVVAALLAAAVALGEQAEQTAPPTSFQNPYTAGASQPESAPRTSQLPRRKTGIYLNPLAAKSTAPPMVTPPLPGPVSRWRRSLAQVDDHSPIRAAILTSDLTDLIEPTHIPWGPLPAAEKRSERGAAQNLSTDAPAATHFARPPDPLEFDSDAISQPAWLTVESHAARPAGNGGVQTTTYEADRRSTASDTGRRRATQSDADVSPELVSGMVDSPEVWLTQAQELARKARSVDELSTVADLCQRGLAGRPSAELSSSLRRLGAWAHNRRGELLVDGGRDDEAIRDFQIAISLDPNCSLAIHNRGVTLAQQNQLAAALRDFNRVIDLNPGLAVAYRNRAELLAALGRMDEAVADYSRAIESMPDDAELYAARSYARQRGGDYDRARSDLDRAIELAPEQPNTYAQRGNLAADQGDFEQALADFQRALTIDPNAAEARRSLAWLHATCSDERYRNPVQSLTEAQQAMTLSAPDDFLALETLAAAHAANGHFDDAVRLQQQAISAAPDNLAEPLRQRLALYQQGTDFLNGQETREVRAASHESPTARPSPDLRAD